MFQYSHSRTQILLPLNLSRFRVCVSGHNHDVQSCWVIVERTYVDLFSRRREENDSSADAVETGTLIHILRKLITSENNPMYIEDDVIMLATVLMVVTASGIGIPLRI